MRLLRVTTLLGLLAAPAAAQRIDGVVEVDLPRGGIVGDVCVRDARSGDTLRFDLNRGLNVKRVRDPAGRPLPFAEEPAPGGVGVRYAVRDTAHAGGYCVEYMGAFPVYDVRRGDFRHADASDVVAFNGATLRARGESLWIPAPRHGGRASADLPVRLRLRCAACARLYLNGAGLRAGPEAELRTETAHEPFLLAGDFPVAELHGTTFLGEAVASDTAALFTARLREIQRFYEGYLGVPYGTGLVVLRHTPVRRERPGQLWGFMSWPALAFTGVGVGDLARVLGDTADAARPALLGFVAHELAHYYFAGVAAPGSPHFQLFSEPFATFLGLKAVRRFAGEEAYRRGVADLHARAAGPELPTLDRADPRAQGGDRFRYGYAPLLLFALEREVGEASMRAVLRELLRAPAAQRARADYAHLRVSALRAGVPAATWARFEARCVRAPVAGNPCLVGLAE
jgi:hypothetical protein